MYHGFSVGTLCHGADAVSHMSGVVCLADPYLNADAGTMSPFEHGEVFVLDDGGEVTRGERSMSWCLCTLRESDTCIK